MLRAALGLTVVGVAGCVGRRQTAHTRYTRASNARWSPIMNKRLITVDPEIHSGTPVFAGTRVPVKTLFDHLEAGDSLEVFLDEIGRAHV